MESQISQQKLKLSMDLLKLRKKENSESLKCNCNGKRFCRIFHNKHNWRISVSHTIEKKLVSISPNSCNICDKAFNDVAYLKKHVEEHHYKNVETVRGIGGEII